jgi:putative methionine-R-sulfoxide reductase with GAF domain/HAMP domain-containing protein
VINSMPLAVGLSALASALVILAGRPSAGGTVFITSMALGLLAGAASLADLGLLFASIFFIASTAVGIMLLPRRFLTWLPFLGVGVAALILLIDLYAPWPRDWIAANDQQVANIISGVMLVIYGGFIVSQFKNFPLGTKLVMISLVGTILPMVLVGFMSNVTSRLALEEKANQSLRDSASQVAASLDSFVASNLDHVRVQAQLNEFLEYLETTPEERAGSDLEDDVMDHLAAFRNADPVFITSYGLIDRNGLDVADTYPPDVGDDKSSHVYFTEAVRTGQPYVSSLFQSPATGQPSIFFSAPIRNAGGGIVGVLRIRYRADILQQQVVRQGAFSGSRSLALVVDDHDVLLAHSAAPQHVYKSIHAPGEFDAEALIEAHILDDLPAEKLLSIDLPTLVDGLKEAGAQTNFTGWFHGPEVTKQGDPAANVEQAAAVRMSTRPWYVVVAHHQEDLFAPVERQTRGILVIGMVAAVLGVLFAVLISNYLTRPVVRLTGSAARLAAGDLSARSDVDTGDEIGVLAATFNDMAGQLRGLVGTLEQRVAERTRALATNVEIGRRLSTLLDVDVLAKTVVEHLQAAFQFYHVQVYLYDADRETFVLAGGTGEKGQAMLAKGHQLSRSQGLVGRAAETGLPVLAADVTQDPGWLPNPLLPETKSELAVPIAIGETVLGVLDVQQDRVNGLAESEVDLLQSIASQVAVALQNARSYAATQQRANREALLGAIGQRIQRTTSTEEALRVAVRELGRALGAETTVRLGARPENGRQENN